ncbi:MAG: SH3 domain-containing protein [Clostridia bacterium]|nr:SH3 domain-containing protein [Clostridia bacterium]
MKRLMSFLLMTMLLVGLLPAALAYDYWDESYPSYEVTAPATQKRIYMYAKPSSSGNPVASYVNGTIVRVVNYDIDQTYCYAVGPDNKEGYLRKAWLTIINEYSYDDPTLEEYRVIAEQKTVYIFAKPSESGQPFSAYPKGEILKMIDYDSNQNFAYVVGPDNKAGYIRKNVLMKIYDYEDESFDPYRVTSTYASGYAYLYPTASTSGTPLSKYDNGTVLKVIDAFSYGNFALVVGPDGNAGYVAMNQLTAETDSGKLGPVFEVFSSRSYCYMYAKPNSGSTNLGRYNNGEQIEIIDWGADNNYAFVRGVKDNKYGYIQKTSLHPASVNPVKGYMKIRSTANSYAYLYQKASDGSTNLGRYNNGTQVGIIDWAASDFYALVQAPDGKIGYIKKNCLVSLFD